VRLFQNSGVYATYRARFETIAAGTRTFDERLAVFMADRYAATHHVKPVIEGDESAFFTNVDDEILQHQWAREHGMNARASLEDILLAQIEAHRTEVFYNLDPLRFASAFVRRLPVRLDAIRNAGYSTVATVYSKQAQWTRFVALCA